MLAEDRNHDLVAGSESALSKTQDKFIPTKSYDRAQWMHSRGAREIRILCEYMEVKDRLRANDVYCTFTILGSARALCRSEWEERVSSLRAKMQTSAPEQKDAIEAEFKRVQSLEWMCEYYEKVKELSRKLSEWALTKEARQAVSTLMKELPSASGYEYSKEDGCQAEHQPSPVAVCSGAGPGFMEAACAGSQMVPGSRSVGMGISLPFETGLNKYVDKELAFSFHYFFTRKFWMVYSAIGVVVAPGGYGTLDELFEFLTLKQTGKLKRDIPVVLLGTKFWKEVVNFERLSELGLIHFSDVSSLLYTDDVDEAFEYLRSAVISGQLILGNKHVHKSLRKE